MEKSQLLLTVLELSVALAGFSGIVASYQFRDVSNINRGNATGLTIILNLSLTAGLNAAIPLVLLSFGIKDSLVWTIGSLSVASTIIYHLIMIRKNHTQFTVRKKITRIIFAFIYLLCILMVLLNILNALDIVFHRQFGPIFLGMLVALGITCMSFARMLLLPVWKIVQKRELENPNNKVK